MPQKFVNLENLTSFWGNAKEYIDNERQEIEDQLYNWQKTEKAPVVQCEPVPNSELHPIVNFSFTETPPASGEKALDNPSTITGVDSVTVTRCGKNILELNKIDVTASTGLTNATLEEDGALYVEGTTTTTGYVYFGTAGTMPSWAIAGKTYTASIKTNYEHCTFGVYTSTNSNSWTSQYFINPGNSASFQIGNDTVRCMFRLQVAPGYATNFRVYLQIEEGPTATSFEPYSDTAATISLGETYYGGFVDLSTGMMTVTHKYLTVSALTAVDAPNNNLITCRLWPSSVTENLIYDSTNTCLEFPMNPLLIAHTWSIGSKSQDHFTNPLHVRFSKSDFDFSSAVDPNNPTATETRAIINNYLSNNPLHFVLSYEFPKTVQLTPIQIKSLPSLEGTSKRINTIYTDADSIQVEYQKYIGIDSTLDNNSVNAIQNKVVNSALNTKVSLTGDEIIAGSKTFSSPINGSITGDAGTVAGHIVSKDVPVNAAFTDTTYDPATQSTAGLMSASDKVKLDAVGSVFSFKGSVTNSSSLPASDNVNGDAYFAEDTGHVHVYDGTNFVDIGVWAGIPSATDAQIDALFED